MGVMGQDFMEAAAPWACRTGALIWRYLRSIVFRHLRVLPSLRQIILTGSALGFPRHGRATPTANSAYGGAGRDFLFIAPHIATIRAGHLRDRAGANLLGDALRASSIELQT